MKSVTDKQIAQTPRTHLVTSGGRWGLIHQGQPLCAMTTREQALACATHFKLDAGSIVWDGDLVEWIAI